MKCECEIDFSKVKGLGNVVPLMTEIAQCPLCKAAPALLAACELFMKKWKSAGPQGSHQFEKFDIVVHEMVAAIATANAETTQNKDAQDGPG